MALTAVISFNSMGEPFALSQLISGEIFLVALIAVCKKVLIIADAKGFAQRL